MIDIEREDRSAGRSAARKRSVPVISQSPVQPPARPVTPEPGDDHVFIARVSAERDEETFELVDR